MIWLLNCKIPGREGNHHIGIDGSIKAVSQRLPSIPRNDEHRQFYFEQAIAFPGLINSHDHLDFSLYPPMGNKTYANYVEWGADIHTNNKPTIQGISKIPRELAVQYGMYKNLLAGVTTVIHHGEAVDAEGSVVNIKQDDQSIHSVMRGKKWRWHLNYPRRSQWPVVIHTGEGTDASVQREIDSLLRWNWWKRPLIGVHAISMTEKQAARFRALIWCPVSNYFLYGQTAPMEKLAAHTAILFGSDSPLTGSWNFWEHLRVARSTKKFSDQQLFDMVTSRAAEIWKLNTGKMETGKDADIVIAKATDNSYDAFYQLDPRDLLLVFRKGEPELFDESLLSQMEKYYSPEEFSRIYIDGVAKYVRGDLPGLITEIRKYNNSLSFLITW